MAMRWSTLLIVASCALVPTMAAAQDPHAGHTAPPAKPAPPAAKPKPVPPAAKPQPAPPAASTPAPPATVAKPTAAPTGAEPAASQSVTPAPASAEAPATMDHSAHMAQATDAPKDPIPALTDADRAAAFPPSLAGHAVHDRRLTAFVLFDQLEWQGTGDGGLSFENHSWFGGDVNRLWLRAEADSEDREIETAQASLLYGRSVSRWWDIVAGIRQDFRPGAAQTWGAIGIQGLAPYWFEVEATAYVGEGGRTHARFEAEYQLLFTNRLILEPLVEAEIYGKSDPERGLGAGLSSLDTGLRLRYEFRRELAPYIGVTWNRKFFGTADLARSGGNDVGAVRFAVGLRTWF